MGGGRKGRKGEKNERKEDRMRGEERTGGGKKEEELVEYAQI